MIRVEVDAELTRQGLQDLAADYPKIGRLTLYRTAQGIYRKHGVYAKQMLKQGYKRTGTLRKARRIVKTDQGYIVILDPVSKRGKPYLVYVRGAPTNAEPQARIHRRRWTPTVTILNEELAKLPPLIKEHVLNSLRKAAQETQRGK